ncbi:hypothetical protein IH992_28790 [Candidatus Poribacteria bacterium]|nr:hypothetical protein [Candidatus Poribacteria bacterium]
MEQCTQAVLKIPLESKEKRRDYVACFCVLSNLVYEEAVVQKLMEEIQTMIDIENSTVIKMFTEKAHQKGSREAYIDALPQVVGQEFGQRGIQELEPRIRAIENAQKLASLVVPAYRATSVEEFKQTLERV